MEGELLGDVLQLSPKKKWAFFAGVVASRRPERIKPISLESVKDTAAVVALAQLVRSQAERSNFERFVILLGVVRCCFIECDDVLKILVKNGFDQVILMAIAGIRKKATVRAGYFSVLEQLLVNISDLFEWHFFGEHKYGDFLEEVFLVLGHIEDRTRNLQAEAAAVLMSMCSTNIEAVASSLVGSKMAIGLLEKILRDIPQAVSFYYQALLLELAYRIHRYGSKTSSKSVLQLGKRLVDALPLQISKGLVLVAPKNFRDATRELLNDFNSRIGVIRSFEIELLQCETPKIGQFALGEVAWVDIGSALLEAEVAILDGGDLIPSVFKLPFDLIQDVEAHERNDTITLMIHKSIRLVDLVEGPHDVAWAQTSGFTISIRSAKDFSNLKTTIEQQFQLSSRHAPLGQSEDKRSANQKHAQGKQPARKRVETGKTARLQRRAKPTLALSSPELSRKLFRSENGEATSAHRPNQLSSNVAQFAKEIFTDRAFSGKTPSVFAKKRNVKKKSWPTQERKRQDTKSREISRDQPREAPKKTIPRPDKPRSKLDDHLPVERTQPVTSTSRKRGAGSYEHAVKAQPKRIKNTAMHSDNSSAKMTTLEGEDNADHQQSECAGDYAPGAEQKRVRVRNHHSTPRPSRQSHQKTPRLTSNQAYQTKRMIPIEKFISSVDQPPASRLKAGSPEPLCNDQNRGATVDDTDSGMPSIEYLTPNHDEMGGGAEVQEVIRTKGPRGRDESPIVIPNNRRAVVERFPAETQSFGETQYAQFHQLQTLMDEIIATQQAYRFHLMDVLCAGTLGDWTRNTAKKTQGLKDNPELVALGNDSKNILSNTVAHVEVTAGLQRDITATVERAATTRRHTLTSLQSTKNGIQQAQWQHELDRLLTKAKQLQAQRLAQAKEKLDAITKSFSTDDLLAVQQILQRI